jgi:hypothetical protein
MALATQNDGDGVNYTGATSSTIKFTLLGGKYSFFGSAAGTSSVLSILLPDGSTYVAVQSETTSAFNVVLDLPPGSYEIVVVSAGAQSGGCIKIPYSHYGSF